jgi:hypothetical protein
MFARDGKRCYYIAYKETPEFFHANCRIVMSVLCVGAGLAQWYSAGLRAG